MLNDKICRAVDQGGGRALSTFEIAAAAGVRPSEMDELKRRLQEMTQGGMLEKKGKGYRRAGGGPQAAPAKKSVAADKSVAAERAAKAKKPRLKKERQESLQDAAPPSGSEAPVPTPRVARTEASPARRGRGAARIEKAPASPERDAGRIEKAPARPERGAARIEKAPASPERGAARIEKAPASPERGAARIEKAAASPERGAARIEKAPARPERGVARGKRPPTRPERGGGPVQGAKRSSAITGIVRAKKEGYGFLQRLDGEGEDLFLPPHEIARVMDGDRVRVRIIPGKYGRDVAEVVEVLEHRRKQVLGTYFSRGKTAWIEPLDPLLPPRIPVPAQRHVEKGKVVKATITQYGEEGGLRGEVLEEAGDLGDPRVEVLEIAYRRGFSDLFPPEVRQEAERIPDQVLPGDWEGRRDLTKLRLITIDGPDAQDFDDAIFVETLPRGGFRLVVAIADVAHYVQQGTALDEEAFLRGNSLYTPTAVLPMLPEKLSNGICSLQQGVERLCMVADIIYDKSGARKESEFYEGVMSSHARTTYDQVAELLEGKPHPELQGIRRDVQNAAKLAKVLRAKRLARGSLDFDLPEGRILLDEDSMPTGVVRRDRNEAHRLIEEFMLAANEAVARAFSHRNLPTVYRVHDQPNIEKLEAFAKLGRAVGFELDVEEGIPPVKLGELLRSIEGSPQQKALNMLLLRAMMQAVYSPENIGHYGLGAEYYLHFTAPIRRYPDLAVHRLLKESWARGGRGLGPEEIESQTEELQAVAVHASGQERAAMEAEREADRFLKCLFMQDHVGERFDASVIGVTDFGIFAEIDDFLIEGLVRGEEIGVEFFLDEERQRLVFPGSGRSFGVGEKVRVEVSAVDVSKRQIHMALVADEEGRLLPPASESAEAAPAAAPRGGRRARGAGPATTAPQATRPAAAKPEPKRRGAAEARGKPGASAGRPKTTRPGKAEREARKRGK